MDAIEPLVAEIERAFADVERRLQDPEVYGDPAKLADAGRQHRRLKEANDLATAWRAARQQRADAQELLEGDADAEMREFAQGELDAAREAIPDLEEKIRLEMVERDPAVD